MGWLNLDAGNGLSGVKSGVQRGLGWCYQMCLLVQALSIELGLIDTKIRCGVVGVFGSPDRQEGALWITEQVGRFLQKAYRSAEAILGWDVGSYILYPQMQDTSQIWRAGRMRVWFGEGTFTVLDLKRRMQINLGGDVVCSHLEYSSSWERRSGRFRTCVHGCVPVFFLIGSQPTLLSKGSELRIRFGLQSR